MAKSDSLDCHMSPGVAQAQTFLFEGFAPRPPDPEKIPPPRMLLTAWSHVWTGISMDLIALSLLQHPTAKILASLAPASPESSTKIFQSTGSNCARLHKIAQDCASVPQSSHLNHLRLPLQAETKGASCTTSRTSGCVNSPKAELAGRRKLASMLMRPRTKVSL